MTPAAAAPATSDRFASVFVSASDGLQLHARCIGPARSSALPVVCLPGLTRTAADFDVLATALAADNAARRVIAVDYRGRGLSDYDRDPAKYTPDVEMADVMTMLDALDIRRAIFIGTSRGGILTMLLATGQPALVAAAVLNDIGPVIEPQGLVRIKSYVGKLPEPANYGDAATLLRRLFGAQFPNLTENDWLASARRAFKEEDGRLVPTYDINLARTLDAVTPDMAAPTLWPQFDALAGVPVMVIRGLLSDLLSAETVAAMQMRHPSLEVVEVANQGHAPLLADHQTIARISAFVDAVDPSH